MDKTENKSFSHTVFLPKTSFSMKANLVQKEPQILKFWQENFIYSKMLKKRENSKVFYLHDGPPYANGHIHIGHALNKILKDFVVKSYSILGYKTPFIPGWDCHGLPIEQQLLKELKISKKNINDVSLFRKKAKDFALKFINIQREEFKRLGVFGDWDSPYITMSNQYEATIVRAFLELLEKGYIERDKKTIYWCPICETALADAEVEYKDKISPSIYVKFKVLYSKFNISNLYLVVWTTTPWTLPSNIAVALKEDEFYSIIKVDRLCEEYLIIATKLIEDFSKNIDYSFKEIKRIKGLDFADLVYEAPLIELLDESHKYPRKVIFTDFVEMSSGTGIVHIAPGHGEEDYLASRKWNLEVFCPVDEAGKFTNEIKDLNGKFVFEANEVIIEMLKKKNILINSSSISHSYPHCWRCKQPIIFRATKQWFLKIDKGNLREKLIQECNKVNWIPSQGYERITSMIRVRPDWCLSRQRYWGTPIIAFWCRRCGKLFDDFKVLYAISDRIAKEGSDFWFTETSSQILKNCQCECGSNDFEKEKDILDVWLDSGISWYAVCRNVSNVYPVDLYLEGSDQHRGWFQTSLIPSVALNSKAPYRTVLTHGFVLDEDGRAMHKSLGNVVSPNEVISKYGAEILRMWVALSDWREDVRISDSLLSVPIDLYRKIRNTFRYLIGSLSDFSTSKKIEIENMTDIDKYILSRLTDTVEGIKLDWQKYDYKTATKRIVDFCIIDLSSFYLDVLKDRLYTFPLNSKERRSSQTAIYEILKVLSVVSAPIISFTCEEVWQVFRNEVDPSLSESVFLNNLDDVYKPYKNVEIVEKYNNILKIRENILKEIELVRKRGEIGSSLECKIVIEADGDLYSFIKSNISEITMACIVSQIEVVKGDFKIMVRKADGKKCPRCWQWRTDIGKDENYPQLCLKCADAIKENAKYF
ncbi:MAG: isoleucine--tRNA ligase [Elusimicrobiales bacterium]|nr:isoleucine--tRNA ligase [Elusimicrobiales bacterium]